MKTIFITIPWFWPAYKAGGPVQSMVNMLREYRGDVQFKIFTSNCDLNNEPLVNIETGKWVTYNAHTEVWYATTHARSETLLNQVKLARPDVLFIIGMYDWHFNIVPLLFCKAPKKIVSVRGMLHPGALSVKSLKKKIFLQGWKLGGLYKKVLFHVTDDMEQQHVISMFGQQAHTMVAANFPRLFTAKPVAVKQPGHLKLVSVALVSPMKNHLLVLQALQFSTAQIEYHIYGPVKDTAYWQLCSSQIEQLPANVKVIYHGDVQTQLVEASLKQGEVFILPSKSENFGHSFAEAFSAGLPVITSHDTPWNELQEHNAGINVNPAIEALSNAINYFAAMDNDQYQDASRAAAQYIHSKINVEALQQAYERLFA